MKNISQIIILSPFNNRLLIIVKVKNSININLDINIYIEID